MIQLTSVDGKSIWVNLSRALLFVESEYNKKKCTFIEFGGGYNVFVKETPKSIGERLLKIMIFGGR